MQIEDNLELKNYNRAIYGNGSIVEESMRMPCIQRMDILFVDFGLLAENCLIHKCRPAIVVSTTEYNRQSPVMQVIPMSRQLKGLDRNYHVFIDQADCDNLRGSGMAMIEQMQTIDRRQVQHRIGCVIDQRLIEKLGQAVRFQLGMEGVSNGK